MPLVYNSAKSNFLYSSGKTSSSSPLCNQISESSDKQLKFTHPDLATASSSSSNPSGSSGTLSIASRRAMSSSVSGQVTPGICYIDKFNLSPSRVGAHW